MEESKAMVEEDLEDGEIESDGEGAPETTAANDEKKDEALQTEEKVIHPEKNEQADYGYSKSGKKKKSKSHKSEQKSKDKSKKRKRFENVPVDDDDDDDFASNVEKLRKAIIKRDNEESQYEDSGERRKHRKRKKEGRDGASKKRKKQEQSDEIDENEMMCVRGASPVHKSPSDQYQDDRDSYSSDSSHDSRGHDNHRSRRRNRSQPRERNKNKSNNDRRRGAHPMQDPDGVCLYFMQGKCHKGDDCLYSHDAQPPRKMELCKFYLMDCCAKRDKCLYMHADFPCKYYHTGLPCIYKDECKFAHGKPLTEGLKNILLKHIESAPKEILGDFPRLNREGAFKMMHTTQQKLLQQYPECAENQDRNIPSLFELNVQNPQIHVDNIQPNQYNDRQHKISPKVRHSRWQNDNLNQNLNSHSPNSSTGNVNVLSIKNLTGVLTPRQISDLTKMGIENLDQLGQLTVLQLNSIGISVKQITEIQLNTMSIQKLGLINTNVEQKHPQFTNVAQDLDLRVPPTVPVGAVTINTDFPGKDIDMRFQPPGPTSNSEKIIYNDPTKKPANKDTIDIDQYTKDALKFASKDKENEVSSDNIETDNLVIAHESKDVDHRVLPFTEEAPKILQHVKEDEEQDTLKKECDTDIRFLQPDPIFKSLEKRHRRSTTDDEDNLCIDEKWYSSDEEKCTKRKSPNASPVPQSRSPQTPVPQSRSPQTPVLTEPSSVLSRLGDLSKIDISEEVTKLLNTMKNNLHENKNENTEVTDVHLSRDPRARRSPDKTEKSNNDNAFSKPKKVNRISIYECVDGEPTDGRRRSDVDLRKIDLPSFGDTDLRQSTSGDIDLRLGLPFKAIPNYTPASEIDGSINSHPPLLYKLVPIEIPRPDYSDIRDSTAKSQALVDPRLRKVFRLSVDESNSDSEKSTVKVPTGPRVDPRRKAKEESGNQEQKNNSLDIQVILQNSNWYKDLSSTQKIFVNQHLAPVTQTLKQFHQEKVSGVKFDLLSIQNNPTICSIFTSLGITLSDNGEYSYLPKAKEALLKTPLFPNQAPNIYGNMPLPMEGGNRNMMNMPMGMPPGYNPAMSDPRSGMQPGLLGIAPNVPHNFGNNFGGPNNFTNMPFNGPGPGGDFGFMDGDPNYPRFPNNRGGGGGQRGRGNERWNRGGPGRGNRDRKNFNDRGNWKNDRS